MSSSMTVPSSSSRSTSSPWGKAPDGPARERSQVPVSPSSCWAKWARAPTSEDFIPGSVTAYTARIASWVRSWAERRISSSRSVFGPRSLRATAAPSSMAKPRAAPVGSVKRARTSGSATTRRAPRLRSASASTFEESWCSSQGRTSRPSSWPPLARSQSVATRLASKAGVTQTKDPSAMTAAASRRSLRPRATPVRYSRVPPGSMSMASTFSSERIRARRSLNSTRSAGVRGAGGAA